MDFLEVESFPGSATVSRLFEKKRAKNVGSVCEELKQQFTGTKNGFQGLQRSMFI